MEKYVHRRSDRHLPPTSLIVFAALLCGVDQCKPAQQGGKNN